MIEKHTKKRNYGVLLLLIAATILLPVSGAYLGFYIGDQYASALSHGRFERWKKLEAPPGRVTGILAAGENELYVMTTDGISYNPDVNNRFKHSQNQPWVTVDQVPKLSTTNACYRYYDYSIPKPPTGVIDSAQASTCRPEIHAESHYVLLGNGEIWVWNFGTYGWGPFVQVLIIVAVGFVTGVTIAVVLWRRVMVTELQAAQHPLQKEIKQIAAEAGRETAYQHP